MSVYKLGSVTYQESRRRSFYVLPTLHDSCVFYQVCQTLRPSDRPMSATEHREAYAVWLSIASEAANESTYMSSSALSCIGDARGLVESGKNAAGLTRRQRHVLALGWLLRSLQFSCAIDDPRRRLLATIVSKLDHPDPNGTKGELPYL